jgi:hypothetical protein
VPNGARNVSLTFVYHAGSGGIRKGLLELTVPRGWNAPSTAPKARGYTTVDGGKLSIHGRTLVVALSRVGGGDSVTLTYGSTDGGGPGAVGPSGFVGTQTWQTRERSAATGRPLSIQYPARISVLAPDGSGSLSVASGAVTPGSAGNTVVFVFSAGYGGMSGGTIVLTVPTGWDPPSTDPSSPGYVTASPGDLRISGRKIILSGLTLFSGATATIVYGSRSGGGRGAAAPTQGGAPATWGASEQSSLTGRLRPLAHP